MAESAFSFPKPTLSLVVPAGAVKPTYTTLKVLQKEINQNAMSVKTRFAGGNFGYLALTISEAELLKLTGGIAYVPPVSPPEVPFHLPTATGPQITETNRQYAQATKEWNTYCAMDKELVNCIVNAVPGDFIAVFEDKDLGYGNTTALELLTHLWTTYGQIESEEMELNRMRMSKPWHFPTPIERLFGQLKDAMEFAAEGGDPISEKSALRAGEINISDNPEFATTAEKWRMTEPAKKTMIAFKLLFAAKDKDLRRTRFRAVTSGATSGEAGYHSVNQIYEIVPPDEVVQKSLKDAMAAVSLEEVANVATTPPRATTGPSYCHFHGIMAKGGHTSATCKNRDQPGHQIKATLHNKMGGNTKTFVPYYKRAPTEE